MRRWFDAHLDLAYLAVCGRDMTRPLKRFASQRYAQEAGPHPPAAVTLASLRAGGVCDVLGTIFTEPNGDGPFAYPKDDPEAAHEAGLRQLRCYHNWIHDGGVRLSTFDGAGASHRQTDAAPTAYRSTTPTHTEQTIHIGLLMENADPVRTPDELAWWAERGLIAIGLTWGRSSRYASGNADGGPLTDLGRVMVDAIDDLGLVHDLSHLAQESTDQVLARAKGPVMASHSNCRALLDGTNERHLSDATIGEIVRRDGVIGLNLAAPFLRPGIERGERPSVPEALDHVERVCAIAGDRRHVGLGSDMDGGFSAEHLPKDINEPVHLERLAEGLQRRGWSEEEIDGFAHQNWMGFFERVGRQSSAR